MKNKKQDIKVLVVDDEIEIQKILSKILIRKGYAVETAGNGKEALSLMRKVKPDIVLLDIMMPKLDGIETLRRIKALHEKVIVMMITAYGSIKTAREAMRFGAYDYITKPFDMDFIYQIIEESLKETEDFKKLKAA